MASLNKVQLIGYVGDEPDFRKLDSGVSVAVFSLATTARWKNKEGDKKERTEWHRVVCYRGMADVIHEHV